MNAALKSRRMEKGRRIQSMRNAGACARFTLSKAGARRVSGLVAALEISPRRDFEEIRYVLGSTDIVKNFLHSWHGVSIKFGYPV